MSGETLSFGQYVQKYCLHNQNISKEDLLMYLKLVDGYARLGEEYLTIFITNQNESITSNKFSDMDYSDICACVLWCLIKKSYESNKPFGKGMFNISYTANIFVENLYLALKNSDDAYPRLSSHYQDIVENNCGIDADEGIPWPFKFKTVVFGLCNESDGSRSLYFKPETAGTNYCKKPSEAIMHGFNYISSIFAEHNVDGTMGYRETDEIRPSRRGDRLQHGNELRFLVLKTGVVDAPYT